MPDGLRGCYQYHAGCVLLTGERESGRGAPREAPKNRAFGGRCCTGTQMC